MKNIPVIRSIAWESALFRVLILFVFMDVAAYLGKPSRLAPFIGVVLFVLLEAITKYAVERPNRRGMALVVKGQFEQAVPHFEAACKFYTRHAWIDRFRYLLIISARMSFREMALVNLAVCHAQIGNGTKSKQYYQQALAEFPKSALAQMALKAIQAYESQHQ